MIGVAPVVQPQPASTSRCPVLSPRSGTPGSATTAAGSGAASVVAGSCVGGSAFALSAVAKSSWANGGIVLPGGIAGRPGIDVTVAAVATRAGVASVSAFAIDGFGAGSPLFAESAMATGVDADEPNVAVFAGSSTVACAPSAGVLVAVGVGSTGGLGTSGAAGAAPRSVVIGSAPARFEPSTAVSLGFGSGVGRSTGVGVLMFEPATMVGMVLGRLGSGAPEGGGSVAGFANAIGDSGGGSVAGFAAALGAGSVAAGLIGAIPSVVADGRGAFAATGLAGTVDAGKFASRYFTISSLVSA